MLTKESTELSVKELTRLAKEKLAGKIRITPLELNAELSEKYQAKIYLKREDQQVVRSYKIRGAYFKMLMMLEAELASGVVCASAGNHAQGVAFACYELKVTGHIFMPVTTPKQKVKQVEKFGKDTIRIILQGDTFDDCNEAAKIYALKYNLPYIHPFDDPYIIAGQSTVAQEISEQLTTQCDYVIIPVGGGGLASGFCSVMENKKIKLVGVEPTGAPSLTCAIKNGKPTNLESIDSFVDGAAVKKIGQLNFQICKDGLDRILTVNEGKVCTTLLELYNHSAMVVEPAGALSIAVLDQLKDEIKGKTVVCVVSGGNNDITRMEEIKERSLIDLGQKHYYMVDFPQRAGALKDFVNHVLNKQDDIVYFQYIKKNAREKGPVLIGIETPDKSSDKLLAEKMRTLGYAFRKLPHQELNVNEEFLSVNVV